MKKSCKFQSDYIQLLVIADNRQNYMEVFKDTTVCNIPVKVDQAFWSEIFLTTLPCSSKNPHGISLLLNCNTRRDALPHQKEKRVITPHLLLIRNEPRGDEDNDYRNLLYGLLYSGIPAVNSLESVYYGLERVLTFGKLRKLKMKYKERYPLITQYYHQRGVDVIFSPSSYPMVAKVGHAHAGFGKMLIKEKNQLKDLRSVIALHKDYVTTEPFIESDYELRIQKIGKCYRAMKKKLVGGYWKSNSFGSSSIEDVEFTPEYKFWIDESAKILGMEICALDVLHSTKNNCFHILEINGSAIGLDPNHLKEDTLAEKDLVLEKIKEVYFNEKEKKDNTKLDEKQKIEKLEIELITLRNKLNEKKVKLKESEQKKFFGLF